MNPFAPISGGTVSLSATSASSNVQLANVPTGQHQLRLYNAGPSTVFIKRGADNTVTAATTDYPLPSGVVEVISVRNNQDNPESWVAGICAGSGTATVYLTVGTGE